jgi:hypothetical protein
MTETQTPPEIIVPSFHPIPGEPLITVPDMTDPQIVIPDFNLPPLPAQAEAGPRSPGIVDQARLAVNGLMQRHAQRQIEKTEAKIPELDRKVAFARHLSYVAVNGTNVALDSNGRYAVDTNGDRVGPAVVDSDGRAPRPRTRRERKADQKVARRVNNLERQIAKRRYLGPVGERDDPNRYRTDTNSRQFNLQRNSLYKHLEGEYRAGRLNAQELKHQKLRIDAGYGVFATDPATGEIIKDSVTGRRILDVTQARPGIESDIQKSTRRGVERAQRRAMRRAKGLADPDAITKDRNRAAAKKSRYETRMNELRAQQQAIRAKYGMTSVDTTAGDAFSSIRVPDAFDAIYMPDPTSTTPHRILVPGSDPFSSVRTPDAFDSIVVPGPDAWAPPTPATAHGNPDTSGRPPSGSPDTTKPGRGSGTPETRRRTERLREIRDLETFSDETKALHVDYKRDVNRRVAIKFAELEAALEKHGFKTLSTAKRAVKKDDDEDFYSLLHQFVLDTESRGEKKVRIASKDMRELQDNAMYETLIKNLPPEPDASANKSAYEQWNNQFKHKRNELIEILYTYADIRRKEAIANAEEDARKKAEGDSAEPATATPGAPEPVTPAPAAPEAPKPDTAPGTTATPAPAPATRQAPRSAPGPKPPQGRSPRGRGRGISDEEKAKRELYQRYGSHNDEIPGN